MENIRARNQKYRQLWLCNRLYAIASNKNDDFFIDAIIYILRLRFGC